MDNTTRTCPACNGAGYMPIADWNLERGERYCVRCAGSGRIPVSDEGNQQPAYRLPPTVWRPVNRDDPTTTESELTLDCTGLTYEQAERIITWSAAVVAKARAEAIEQTTIDFEQCRDIEAVDEMARIKRRRLAELERKEKP